VRHLFAAAMLALGWPAAGVAQSITEYPVPTANGGPYGITVGPDGALWFTEGTGNKIGRITTAGAITEYPLPTANSGPNGITTGSDGALWFTESQGNKIGRLTTLGAFTEYPITGNSAPIGITAGPDGALWFTQNFGTIGRITTAGAITEFGNSNADEEFPAITTGPDGALWFTNAGPGAFIGRITTAGVLTTYPVPGGVSAPIGITTGPDGALWFTGVQARGGQPQIGRITTTGSITTFTIPNAAYWITTGPDGALWYTETAGNIGRITTAGVVSEFAPPTGSSGPRGITSGPGNTLWFTESGANNIGTFATANLSVAETGSGAGQVTSSVGGIVCSPSSTQCATSVITGTPVTLTASANAGSAFTGWNGGGCSGTAPCTLTVNANTNVTATFSALPSYTLSVSPAGTGSGTVASNPSGINCGTTCSASFYSGTQITLTGAAASGSTFAGWSGGGCVSTDPCTVTLAANTTVTATFVQNTTTNIALQAAVLPLSRSALVGGMPATAFATIINAGPGTASTCSIAPATAVAASFDYQTTDPTTNALTGTADTPVNIAQGAGQSFVIAFTPTAAFAPTNILLTFGCANAAPAPQIVGIDTLNLSASTTPVPDIVAVAASGDPGYVDIPGATGTGDFAVATVNLGSASQITASANTGTANLPVTLLICQTNPSSGACLAAPAINVTTTIAANATPTFGVFATGSAAVPDLPGVNRAFVTFTDANGTLRGETSVAVRTQ